TGSGYTNISEITSLTMDGPKIDSVEVTHLGSTSQTREYIAGLVDPGTIKMDIHYYETQMNTVYTVFSNRTTYYWQITLPDASYWTAQGFATDFSLEGSGPDAVAMAKVSIKLTTKPSFTQA